MDDFDFKFKNAKVSALKQLYGDLKPEFQDGGRIGFKKGTPGTPVGTYPKTSPADLKKVRDYLTSLPEGSNVGLQTLQKEMGIDRGTVRLIVQREFPNLNIGGTAAQSKNMKKVNEERKAKGFRSQVNMEEYTKDLRKKFKFPAGSQFSDAMSNEDLAIKYFGEASEKNLARVQRISAELKKELKLEYPKGDPNKGYLRREERKKKFTPSADDKYILNKQKAQKKALNAYFKNNPKEILNRPKLLKMLNAKLIDGKLDFSPRYDSKKKYIDLAKKGKLFDEFDITPIRSERRGIMYPVNKLISGGKFNQGIIKSIEAYYRKTKGSNSSEVLANKQAIDNYLKEVGVRVDVGGVKIGEKVLPAIDRKTGDLPNIKNTLEKLGVSDLYNVKPSGGVTLGMNTINPDNKKTKAVSQLLGDLGCGKAGGGRIKFAEGSNCVRKGLDIMENADVKNTVQAKKVMNIAKEAGNPKQLKSILNLLVAGSGAAIVAEEVIAETLFAANGLLKGKPLKEAWADSYLSYIPGLLTGKGLDKKSSKDLAVESFKSPNLTATNEIQNIDEQLNSLEENRQTELNEVGFEIEGTTSDITENQINQKYDQRKKELINKRTVLKNKLTGGLEANINLLENKLRNKKDSEEAKSIMSEMGLRDQLLGIPGIPDDMETQSEAGVIRPVARYKNNKTIPKLDTPNYLNETYLEPFKKKYPDLTIKDLREYEDEQGNRVFNDAMISDLMAKDPYSQGTQSEDAGFFGETITPKPMYDFAGGGLAKLAGKRFGGPPESGPEEGLASLKNYVNQY